MRIAQSLTSDPGLSPRDAFHAAFALDGGCDWIVSSDAAFDRVPRLRRLGL
jgi:predicted nucleic acid-binding protein